MASKHVVVCEHCGKQEDVPCPIDRHTFTDGLKDPWVVLITVRNIDRKGATFCTPKCASDYILALPNGK